MWRLFKNWFGAGALLTSPQPRMSIRTISLNEVPVSEKETHIVIYHGPTAPTSASASTACVCDCFEKLGKIQLIVRDMEKEFNALSKRLLQLELRDEALPASVPHQSSPFFSAAVAPEPTGIIVRRLSEAASMHANHTMPPITHTTFQEVVNALLPVHAPLANTPVDDDNEEDVEEDAGDEEEEVALELEEFEFKGATYFRDTENLVYQKDADDDLDDTPIGIWNEAKQKVIRYARG